MDRQTEQAAVEDGCRAERTLNHGTKFGKETKKLESKKRQKFYFLQSHDKYFLRNITELWWWVKM